MGGKSPDPFSTPGMEEGLQEMSRPTLSDLLRETHRKMVWIQPEKEIPVLGWDCFLWPLRSWLSFGSELVFVSEDHLSLAWSKMRSWFPTSLPGSARSIHWAGKKTLPGMQRPCLAERLPILRSPGSLSTKDHNILPFSFLFYYFLIVYLFLILKIHYFLEFPLWHNGIRSKSAGPGQIQSWALHSGKKDPVLPQLWGREIPYAEGQPRKRKKKFFFFCHTHSMQNFPGLGMKSEPQQWQCQILHP